MDCANLLHPVRQPNGEMKLGMPMLSLLPALPYSQQ